MKRLILFILFLSLGLFVRAESSDADDEITVEISFEGKDGEMMTRMAVINFTKKSVDVEGELYTWEGRRGKGERRDMEHTVLKMSDTTIEWGLYFFPKTSNRFLFSRWTIHRKTGVYESQQFKWGQAEPVFHHQGKVRKVENVGI